MKRLSLYDVGVDQMLVQENFIEDIETKLSFSNGVYWLLTDHLGTVSHTVSEANLSTSEIYYSPFGYVGTPPAGCGVTALFAGRDLDFNTGLYNNRARWYNPNSGRFISQDPIGFAGGDTNLYRYCGNSPANATDPSGQIWHIVGGAVVGGIIGGIAYAFTEGEFDFGDFATYVGSGAVAGAVTAGTLGVGTVIAGKVLGAGTLSATIGGGVISGSAGAMAGNAIQQNVDIARDKQEEFDWGQLGASAGYGAIGGAIGSGIGVGLSKAAPHVANAFGKGFGAVNKGFNRAADGLDDLFRGGQLATANGAPISTGVVATGRAVGAVGSRAVAGIMGGSTAGGSAAGQAAGNIFFSVRNGGGGGGSSSRGQSFGGAKMDVPLQKQLQGKGQIAALRNNRNLKGISADEALRKTPNELLEMYKAGEITAKTLKLLKKPFEGRMFTKK